MEVRKDYLAKLQSKETTTFISDKQADELDRELEKQVNLK